MSLLTNIQERTKRNRENWGLRAAIFACDKGETTKATVFKALTKVLLHS